MTKNVVWWQGRVVVALRTRLKVLIDGALDKSIVVHVHVVALIFTSKDALSFEIALLVLVAIVL